MSISLSGSLLLTGSIVASGNLTTTGTITAQTLVVQTITSSIVNITGSNIFGSRTTDRQTFTGSLFITGSTSTFSGCVGIGTLTPEGVLTIRGTSAQPLNSGTTHNSLLQIVGSLGGELNIGSNTVAGGYGAYIQASDNNLAVNYQLNLQPNGGPVAIGAYCTSTEANLFLGAQGTVEGGQLVLQKGTSCSCATHLDNYQNLFRIMSGTDIASTTVNMSIDHITKMACFTGTVLSTAPNNGHNFRGLGFSTAPIATGGSCLVYSSLDRGLYLISISSSVTSTYGYAAFLWVDSGAITVSSVIRQACVGITTSGRALCVVNQYGSETACMTINTLNLINYL